MFTDPVAPTYPVMEDGAGHIACEYDVAAAAEHEIPSRIESRDGEQILFAFDRDQ